MGKKTTFEDLLDSSEAKDWLFRAEKDLFPKMKKSSCSVVIHSGGADAKQALEIGATILFDKPLILFSIGGKPIPPRLRMIATEIVEVNDTTSAESQAKLEAVLRKVLSGVSIDPAP